MIVGPSAEGKSFGKEKKELAERHILRLRFWEQLLKRAKERGVLLHAQRSPSKDLWVSAGAGVQSGIIFTYLVWMTDESAVELYIDVGDKEENKRLFDSIHQKKSEIEQRFGAPLSWERMDDKRGARVRYVLSEGGLTDESKWPAIQDAMITAMDKLAKTLKPYLTRDMSAHA